MSTPMPPAAGWPPPPGWQPPAPKQRHTVRTVLLSIAGGFLGLLVLVAVIGAVVGGNGSNGGPPAVAVSATDAESTDITDAPAETAASDSPAPPSGTVGRGLGANDASADVKITTCTDSGYGVATGKIAIVNHSPGRSDYFVDITFLDATGTHIGSGSAIATGVEGGQHAVTDLFGSISGKLAQCKITTVQRTASS